MVVEQVLGQHSLDEYESEFPVYLGNGSSLSGWKALGPRGSEMKSSKIFTYLLGGYWTF